MEVETSLGTHRLVHLDLKRAPIKVGYLEKLFPILHSWGATGLLLEWEDTFPYSGNLSEIGSLNSDTKAYSEEDIEKIYLFADHSCLSVIPLVQTFGHLEFVLRHKEWVELQELHNYPSSLCPNHPKALKLVTSMIDQVIAKSPKNIQFFHIGADEVWHLGVCSVCCEQDKHLLLLNHVCAVLKHLKEHYPHVRPIMWDDMLRNVDKHLLSEFSLGDLVDPMIWIYDSATTFHLSEELWDKYSSVFKNMWVASAFKGATGSSQILPIIQHHVSNHERWISELQKRLSPNLIGIALTGWSRYDHYAALCELLPPALPCLALCLNVWLNRGYDFSIHEKVAHSLGYNDVPLLLHPYPRPQAVAVELMFPGWKIAVGVEWLANLKGKHISILHCDQASTWLTPWHIKHNFINPMQIQGLVNSIFELGKEWDALESYMTTNLAEAYYDPTIDEWILNNVHTMKQAAKQLYKNGEKQLSQSIIGHQWEKKVIQEQLDEDENEANHCNKSSYND